MMQSQHRTRRKGLLKSNLASIALLIGLIAPAFGQSAILQGGPWAPGHAPMYFGQGSQQPVVVDSGPAAGGAPGLGLSELLIAAQGTGNPPYIGQGTGPNGETACIYDGPTTAAAGYHYLCFSANVAGAGLITYGAGGIAAPQPLNFNINGTSVVGATCSGSPTSSFASINGVVTHC